MNRETWLNQLAALMMDRFSEMGHPIPAFRVSIGFTGAPKRARALGVCYNASASADKHFEIFIAPSMSDPYMVGAILAHELTHAAVGFACGHKGAFAQVVGALGFERPFTELRIGASLRAWLETLLTQLPALPHAALGSTTPANDNAPGSDDAGDEGEPAERASSNDKPKQTTRMLKAVCEFEKDGEKCGYTVRLSKKWAQKIGACCPVHGGMEVEGADEAAGDEDAA